MEKVDFRKMKKTYDGRKNPIYNLGTQKNISRPESQKKLKLHI